jgi:hypothetical protein
VKYLVDANILRESTKPTPLGVINWLRAHEQDIAASLS